MNKLKACLSTVAIGAWLVGCSSQPQSNSSASNTAAAVDAAIDATMPKWATCAMAAVAWQGDNNKTGLASLITDASWQTIQFSEGGTLDAAVCARFIASVDRATYFTLNGAPAAIFTGVPTDGEEVVEGEPIAWSLFAGPKPEWQAGSAPAAVAELYTIPASAPNLTGNVQADQAIALVRGVYETASVQEKSAFTAWYYTNGPDNQNNGPWSELNRGSNTASVTLPVADFDPQNDDSFPTFVRGVRDASGLEAYADTLGVEAGLANVPGLSAEANFVATVLPDYFFLITAEAPTGAVKAADHDRGFFGRNYGATYFYAKDPELGCQLN